MPTRKPTVARVAFLVTYVLYLGIFLVFVDVVILRNLLGFGFGRHYEEEDKHRYPAPYVAFTGKPNTGDHNEFGFLGASLNESDPDDFKIAFFGGSTG